MLTHSYARVLVAGSTLLFAPSACARMEPDPNNTIALSGPELPREISSSLTGTSWRLVGYDSFESGSERETPTAGEVHKVSFEPGGGLVVQLACNRGTGRWTASQREPDRGSLEISSLAISKNPCPGARMNRMVEDLEYVGSYVIGDDGRLILNLRADSGNLVLERVK